MGQVIHIWGFMDDREGANWPSGVGVTIYEGKLHEVANGVLDRTGHPRIACSTTRDLGGWLEEVHAVIEVHGTRMWHIFTTAREPWPMTDASRPAGDSTPIEGA